MTYRVFYSPEAEIHLTEIYNYIVAAGSPTRAAAFVEEILAACEALCVFPNRGRRRDDLRHGLRTISFRKRVTIIFEVTDDEVNIVGIFYAGLEYEAAFQSDDE
jgi:plasmid stabilization system protein ParE